MICSECLKNIGLVMTAKKFGKVDETACPKCGSLIGLKIDKDTALKIMDHFFIKGSIDLRVGNHYPKYRLLEEFKKISHPLPVSKDIEDDIELLSGLTEHTVDLNLSRLRNLAKFGKFADKYRELINQPSSDSAWKEMNLMLEEMISGFEILSLTEGTRVFTVAANLNEDISTKNAQLFDPVKKETISLEGDRFGGGRRAIFYGAYDINTALFEAHPGFFEELSLGIFETTRKLKILNLENLRKNYDSFDEAERLLSFSSSIIYKQEYLASVFLAKKAAEMGFDGIQYCSYYSKVRNSRNLSLAIFGFPIRDQILDAKGFNRVSIKQVRYDYALGPNFQRQLESKMIGEMSIAAGTEVAATSKEWDKVLNIDIHTLADFVRMERTREFITSMLKNEGQDTHLREKHDMQ